MWCILSKLAKWSSKQNDILPLKLLLGNCNPSIVGNTFFLYTWAS